MISVWLRLLDWLNRLWCQFVKPDSTINTHTTSTDKANLNKANRQSIYAQRPCLANLDDTLYPIHWRGGTYATSLDLLQGIISGQTHFSPAEFSQMLHANETYQDWINFTVFGRYVQRSFAAFYRQSEDCFNADMPELLRHELMRHAQCLPVAQTLFFVGDLPKQTRKEKLLITTLNPATAYSDAQQINSPSRAKAKTSKHTQSNTQPIVNQITITGAKSASRSEVLAFAVRHNPRTREHLRNEVMILDFTDLRLVKETILPLPIQVDTQTEIYSDQPNNHDQANRLDGEATHHSIILRQYELR